MAQDPNNLIWVDMEMSGLDPDKDKVLEVAVIITNAQLETLVEAPTLVVHQADSVLNNMDKWNTDTHGKSGLTQRCRESKMNEDEAAESMVKFIAQYVAQNASPMCGNSVHQDRRFMVRHLPKLEAWFHYRNLDVSTLKELARRWKPELLNGLTKHGRHEALADIQESIAELKYYRMHMLKI